jgi:PadR family transcriptional regulator, regulatory protein PadR
MSNVYQYCAMADADDIAPQGPPQGTLEMLVLRSLTLGPMHGYAIAQHIGRTSEDVFAVEQGSLYPALERLLRKGWVTAKWRQTPTGRQARYYTITALGQKQLGERTAEYDRVAAAIARVLGRA